MKQRFTLLDLRATVNELNERLGNTFIQNFYSTQQRFIYIKFSNKDTLLIESGFRFHLTQNTDSEISHFCKKLREKCRHARVHRIYQFGFDRIVVIDLQRVKIVIEFFSAGNMLILDENNQILELHRPVEELGIVRNSKYIFNPIELDLSFDTFKENNDLSNILPFEKEYIETVRKRIENEFGESLENLKGEEHRDKVERFFKKIKEELCQVGGFGEVTLIKGKPNQLFAFKTVPNALEVNKLLKDEEERNGIANETTIKNKDLKENLNDEQAMEEQLRSLRMCPKTPINLKSREKIEEIIYKNKGINALHFSSFNEAAEYYFSDSQKKKKIKEDKGTRIRKAQEKYIEELETQAGSFEETANILSENRDFVNEILEIFRKVFETKMEWSTFEAFWEEERRNDNPHAKAITSYDLNEKKCIILLEGRHIELDISQPLSKNIEKYFARRKKAVDKGDKTKVALENIVEKLAPKKVIVPTQKREPYWFEKFHFFISTDNELVIGGKNAQQNEIIVKKHLDQTDLYFHCDVHGASSIACKGRSDITIEEASYMALCMSKCWDEGIIKPVFYVEPDQVSKSAPSGEHITKGSFMIKGKRNIANPYRLEYGVGLLFKLECSQSILEFSSNPGDAKILHGMPVSAPWICVKNYKYKIRLCPASEKKSKLCQDIKANFENLSEGSMEERFVKSIGLDEYMNVVPGKSKIAKILK